MTTLSLRLLFLVGSSIVVLCRSSQPPIIFADAFDVKVAGGLSHWRHFGSNGGGEQRPPIGGECGTVPATRAAATSKTTTALLATAASAFSSTEEAKSAILTAIGPTKRGLSVTADERDEIEDLISTLEGMCPVEEVARDSRVGGHWYVRYTTAPPPSNGQLGPFVGVAQQEIGLANGKYTNILKVGPNDWLGATLDADWTEWDGELIVENDEEGRRKWMEGAASATKRADETEDETGTVPPSSTGTASGENAAVGDNIFQSIVGALSGAGGGKSNAGKDEKERDFGATSWRVTFDSLTIRLFGVPVFTKKFEAKDRVWKMTYIDDDTRVVRAGRTGKSEDDVVFYMTRQLE